MSSSKLPIVTFIVFVLAFTLSCGLSDSNNGHESDAPFPCKKGTSKDFTCENVDLFAHLSIEELSGNIGEVSLNDIWGWTDPQTEKEYALVGMTNGVSFVDISEPENPVVLGVLKEILNPSSSAKEFTALHDEEGKGESAWRDIKTFNNHAFIVSDNQPHGLQVFSLTKLRNVASPPVNFEEDAHYSEFDNAHNIAINEATGFAYVVGSNTFGGGLHIIDITTPTEPVFAGFHADSTVGRNGSGYVHDTQCVMYSGPDLDYLGDEVCFNSSETHLEIVNVSDKNNTIQISATDYQGRTYAHQGWLTENHRFFLLGDELDQGNTTTYIWNIEDLDNPIMSGTHMGNSLSIDHNQYVKQNHLYQSNYTSGLQIFSLSNIEQNSLEQVGFFDTFPLDDNRKFDGSWSNYPFFDSGLVIVSDMSNGLFIVRPNLQ